MTDMEQTASAGHGTPGDPDASSSGGLALLSVLKWLLQWGLPFAVLAALAWVLLSQRSPAEIRAVWSRARLPWLLAGLLLYALTNVARALRMSGLLGWPYSEAPRLVPPMFALSLLNNVLPLRTGELSFPYFMQQEGVEWGRSLAALLVSRLLDLLAVFCLFLIAALARYSLLAASAASLVGLAVGSALLLIGVLAALPRLGQWLTRFLASRSPDVDGSPAGWRAALSVQALQGAQALQTMQSARVYRTALVHSLLIWLGTYAWFGCFLNAIDLPTGIAELILGASFAVISKSLPVGSILGFGAHEAGWTLGFTLIGQEASVAILGGLTVNLLTLVASILFGLASLGWLALRSGRSLWSYLPAALQRGTTRGPDGQAAKPERGHGQALAAIVMAFVLLGTTYSVATPLFETPDEVWHYLYVKHIADGGGLPVYQEGVTFPMRQEASQPPLYYLVNGWATAWIDTSNASQVVRYNPHAAIGAPAAWGNRNVVSHTSLEAFPYRGTALAAHLCRLLSVLMGAGTVVCTYAIARRLFPRPHWLALSAAAFNAFHPQFIFISASINNDVPTTLFAALSLWLLVCIVQDGPSPRKLATLGAVLGLAALSKLNGLVLMPLALVVLLALAWKRRQGWAIVRWSIWVFGAAALVGGWWYARNWWLYGDPFGLDLMFAVLPPHAQRPSTTRLLHLLDGALKSFWAVFGWFNIVVEPWIYVLFEVLLVVAVAGLIRVVYRRVAQKRQTDVLAIGLLALWTLTFVVALAGWSQARFPQGRLLFPAISAIATLFILGVAEWFPARVRPTGIAILLTALLTLSFVAPFRYIAPAYAKVQPLSVREREAITHPMFVDLSAQVRLLGFDLGETVVQPGGRIWLKLYWQGLAVMDTDWSVFVHLVDDRGVTIAQYDSYPGAGNNPTRDWEPGQAIGDAYPLDIPATLLAQAPLRLHVGMYDYGTGERLSVHSASVRADYIELPVELGLPTQEATALQKVRFEFGGQIALTGFQTGRIAAAAGDPLRMALRWEALRAISRDYTVFVHLMRAGDQIWGQNDHVPENAKSPTSTWTAGQVVTDIFDLQISPDAPADSYDLVVGLYDSKTVTRLALPSGLDYVVLGKIEVNQE